MNKVPEISVVMTSYNHELYLGAAIESVLNQLIYKDLELIIVDDASTDCSRNIILQYANKDNRIYYLFHKKNLGIARTTNDGFELAKGNFVAYIQSDDIWSLQKLIKQMQILKQNPNLIVWSDAFIINSQGNYIGQLMTERTHAQNIKKSGYLFNELLTKNFICVQSMIFKKSYLQKVCFDTRLFYRNDYKFVLELSKDHEFFYIPEPLIKYRIHSENTHLKNKDAWNRDEFYLLKSLLQKYKNKIPPKIQAKFYYKISNFLFNNNHPHFSRKCLLKTIRKDFWRIKYHKNLIGQIKKPTP